MHLGTYDPDARRPTVRGMIGVVLPAAVLAIAGVMVSVVSVGAQSPEPAASVASPEAATSRPAPELGVGAPTMSAERDGVLLEVWLDHTSLPAGARLNALVRVSNQGTTTVLWQTNICGTGPAETTIAPSRPPDTEVEWTGRAATFKRKLLDNVLAPSVLWDATTIDLENVGCDAYSAIEPFEPGSVAEMTVAWDAVDRPGRPIVPGPATVTSTFETWTPRKQPAEPVDPDHELVASTTIEIVGGMGETVPVARYADIALSDDTFRTWVETRKARPHSWDPFASYWPNDDGVYPDDPRYERATEGTVDIGMFVGNGPYGEVTIDLATLEVLGWRWDRKVEVTGADGPIGDGAASACPPLFARTPDSAVAEPALADTEAPPVEVGVARGRWRRMARAPFGIDTDLAAWTGRHMIITRWDDGRSAAYHPRNDRWREIAAAPRGFDSQAQAVWTGREFIILQADDDEPGVDGVAYDPVEDRWREIEPHPAHPDGEDYGINQPLWSGTHVLVLGPRGDLSAYEPGADCWLELPAMPGDDWATGLYQVGSRFLVESRDRTEDVVSMRAFDPATGTWSDPIPGPLAPQAAQNGGSVIGDRIVYVSWIETDDEAGSAWDAVFDPVTMSWSTFEHDCETPAFRPTIVAGDVLIANDGRRALDGMTLACIDLPKPPRDFNGTEILVWTGSELIVWSGIRSLPEPLRRGGFVYTASR